ncbi:GNAT family N-acetyltransferase [Streptomyces sp. RFCAC02]|uniref:GNAT family N-acetyltransferase n=1 Tax=Streptomyces sp. RFCAC02 TaxID=2499143 RepID=UPI001021ED75|nr:GNAT family N-acetyltransferase [Streptomyces sp. RFCAC02]
MPLLSRSVADDPAAIDAWLRAKHTGFLVSAPLSDEELAERRERTDFSRGRGVFDGDRCVATFRSFDQELTVPGGGVVRSNAVSGVTVTGTHRRRGLLTGMMTEDLAAARERGDTVATLIAAEWRIYGRFGFGPAAGFTQWRVDVPLAGLGGRRADTGAGGSVALVDGAAVRELGPGVYERLRPQRPGTVTRPPLYWERLTGAVRFQPGPWVEPFHAVHRDADGVAQGLVTFRVDDVWTDDMPANVARVEQLVAATPEAERALWGFLLGLDWVRTVKSGEAPHDSLLPLLLPNARAAVIDRRSDLLWLRPLDTAGMLAARTYGAEGELVLDVRDPLGLAGGRFLLSASPEGVTAAPTDRDADLTLDTGALARLYLGDESAVRLAAAGLIEAGRAEAPARADQLFRTDRRPWCPDDF